MMNIEGRTNMCKVISIINNKGGVGKTISTGVIAELLAHLEKKVLVIDLDQQSNLSMMLDQYIEDSENVISGITQPDNFNIADLFKYRYTDPNDVKGLIRNTFISNLDIIPASKRHKHTQLVISMNQTGNKNIILKRAIASLKNDYDYILIDNAPANDILTVNSMYASDMVIVPVRLEEFSYIGLKETIATIINIKEEYGITDIEFGGVFITQAEINTNVYKGYREKYQCELDNKFYKTPIRKDVKISEILSNFCSLLEYCPNTNAVFDYANLILELKVLDERATNSLRQSIGSI